jgi:ElaB/YqjD/DUF883 family membrane-anchored ribosome-binding protein
MAKSTIPGESFPLSLVRKENPMSEPDQKIQTVADAAKETSSQAIQDIANQIKALREQIQVLQSTTADIAATAGHVVASGARATGEKVAEGARIAGSSAVSGARAAGERVTTTVETYPVATVLIASAVAFLLGRASAPYPSHPSYAESAFDGLKNRLSDLSERLPSNLKSALRSSLN